MNEEVRKQLEEMAKDQIGVYDSNTRAAFIIGAQAAWDLATKPTEDDERDAEEYGNQIALPMIRSMYPTISRTEMSHHLAKAFLAGRLGLREAVQAALQKEWKEMHIWKPTLHFCANWDFLLIDKSDGEFEFCTCFNPPREDA